MQINTIFYGILWVSAFSVVWFYTDWVVYYSQLFGIGKKWQFLYQEFKLAQPLGSFADFLYSRSLKTTNRVAKFVLKLASCPLCLHVWLSAMVGIINNDLLAIAPIYIGSLLVTLQIKRMI